MVRERMTPDEIKAIAREWRDRERQQVERLRRLAFSSKRPEYLRRLAAMWLVQHRRSRRDPGAHPDDLSATRFLADTALVSAVEVERLAAYRRGLRHLRRNPPKAIDRTARDLRRLEAARSRVANAPGLLSMLLLPTDADPRVP